jgi:hypothetical protein
MTFFLSSGVRGIVARSVAAEEVVSTDDVAGIVAIAAMRSGVVPTV